MLLGKKRERYRALSDCHVTDTGRIVDGTIGGLHTCEGEMNLDESSQHIHFEGEGIGNFKNDWPLIPFYLDINRSGLSVTPRHTLSGLYAQSKESNHFDLLRGAFEAHTSFEMDKFLEESISTREETREKLLENKYRRMISDQ